MIESQEATQPETVDEVEAQESPAETYPSARSILAARDHIRKALQQKIMDLVESGNKDNAPLPTRLELKSTTYLSADLCDLLWGSLRFEYLFLVEVSKKNPAQLVRLIEDKAHNLIKEHYSDPSIEEDEDRGGSIDITDPAADADDTDDDDTDDSSMKDFIVSDDEDEEESSSASDEDTTDGDAEFKAPTRKSSKVVSEHVYVMAPSISQQKPRIRHVSKRRRVSNSVYDEETCSVPEKPNKIVREEDEEPETALPRRTDEILSPAETAILKRKRPQPINDDEEEEQAESVQHQL